MTTAPTRPRLSRVGIVAKSHLSAAAPHLVEIAAWLAGRGVAAVFENDDGGADAATSRAASSPRSGRS